MDEDFDFEGFLGQVELGDTDSNEPLPVDSVTSIRMSGEFFGRMQIAMRYNDTTILQ